MARKSRGARKPAAYTDDLLNWTRQSLDTQSFVGDLLNKDALAIVLRGHLYAEKLLDDMIGALLPIAPKLTDARLGYERKVAVALALGVLLPGQEKPLVALNALRNRFAHTLGRKLTRGDVNALSSALTPEWPSKRLERRAEESEIEQLRSFVVEVVVTLEDKAERLVPLRPKVMQLHIDVLRAYAARRTRRERRAS